MEQNLNSWKKRGCPMPTDNIIIRVPPELKDVVPVIEELLTAIQGSINQGGAGKSLDYAKVEKAIAETTGKVESASHGVILSSLNTEAKKIKYRGANWVLVLAGQQKEFKTRTGPVRVTHSLYREEGVRNGPTIDPISIRAGVVGDGWLPGTAKEMAYEIQRGPSRVAQRSAKVHHILPYSRASFERTGHGVGDHYLVRQADIEDELVNTFEIPDGAVGVSVSIDRGSIPMEEPVSAESTASDAGSNEQKVTRQYRMGYCATLSYFDKEGESLHTTRYAQMPGVDAPQGLVALMRTNLRLTMQRAPDLVLHRVADGAAEMWNLLDQISKDVEKRPIDVIDFHHVTGKVGAAARVVFGETRGTAQMNDWAPMLKRAPKAIETIHDALISSGHPAVEESEGPVYDALTYIQRNSERMNYDELIAKGLPIGSGAVESTVKSLIEGRMKRPGARWKIRSGDRVLQMRALANSDRWDQAIDLALKPLRGSIRIILN